MAHAADVAPPVPPRAGGIRLLERLVRLSQSAIWDLERDYFEDRGIQAWASGDVPAGSTNSAVLARAYVQVFEGVVADAMAGRFGTFDPDQPFYVVELGAGSGGCAYRFLHGLDPDVLPARPVYVLSDLAESNLSFWRGHPKLQPFLEAGLLDIARFDAVGDETLRLERSGNELRPGDVTNPLVVIANYFFDVLPQDLFVARDGDLFEVRVAMGLPDGVDIDDDDRFRRMAMGSEQHRVPADYYGDRELDAVLATMAGVRGRRFPGRFLFPVVGLRVLQNLRRLAGARLVVLTHERPGSIQDLVTTKVVEAGKDPRNPAAVEEVFGECLLPVTSAPESSDASAQPPVHALPAADLVGLGSHGRSFSLMVEQDAFGAAALKWDGWLFVPRDRPTNTAVSALVTGASDGAPHIRRRFSFAFEEGSPEERYHALFGVPKFRPSEADAAEPDADVPEDERVPPGELSWLLALLRICSYETEIFGEIYPLLSDAIDTAPSVVIDDLVDAMRLVCDRHYPIGGKSDPALAAAALLAPHDRYTEALEFLALSAETRGKQAQVSYNTALCHLRLGDLPAALAAADEAVGFAEPTPGAQELRQAIVKAMEAAGPS